MTLPLHALSSATTRPPNVPAYQALTQSPRNKPLIQSHHTDFTSSRMSRHARPPVTQSLHTEPQTLKGNDGAGAGWTRTRCKDVGAARGNRAGRLRLLVAVAHHDATAVQQLQHHVKLLHVQYGRVHREHPAQ
eukprot:298473-Chlamydomonas_euryale.AAC.1